MPPRETIRRRRPLPPNPYTLPSQPSLHKAYVAALKLETTHQIQGRVLGYLMLEARDDDARDYVASEINNAESECNEAASLDLSQKFIDNLICLLCHQDGRPAPNSDYVEPSDSESETDTLEVLCAQRRRKLDPAKIDPAPRTRVAAKYAALYRDGKRCVATGAYDSNMYQAGALSPAEEADADATENINFTGSTHIFPRFDHSDEGEERSPVPQLYCISLTVTNLFFNVNPPGLLHQRRYTLDAIDIVREYGHIDVIKELEPSHGHRLSNVLTLAIHIRSCFYLQVMWFEPDPVRHAMQLPPSVTSVSQMVTTRTPQASENSYYVDSWAPGNIKQCKPQPLTFTTTSSELELPDRRYLQLHATVCRVAYLSGANAYFLD